MTAIEAQIIMKFRKNGY